MCLWLERRGKVGELGGDDDGREDGGRGSGIVGGLLGREDVTDFTRDLSEGDLPGVRDEVTDSEPTIDDRRVKDAGMPFSSNVDEASTGRGDSCCVSDNRGVELSLSSPATFSDELREVFEVVLGGRSLLAVCL